MVGNLGEWVADWVPQSTRCVPSLFGSDDNNCLAGASEEHGPGALVRGGRQHSGQSAGVFAVDGMNPPSLSSLGVGFRAAR